MLQLQLQNWPMYLMLGSIALLAIGVVMKVGGKHTPLAPDADAGDLRETIGFYRPRVYH